MLEADKLLWLFQGVPGNISGMGCLRALALWFIGDNTVSSGAKLGFSGVDEMGLTAS